jgi:hypothetical protein
VVPPSWDRSGQQRDGDDDADGSRIDYGISRRLSPGTDSRKLGGSAAELRIKRRLLIRNPEQPDSRAAEPDAELATDGVQVPESNP